MSAAISLRGVGPDRALRSLLHLQSSASTARTLNLIAVWRRHGETAGYRDRPFFRSPLLNRAIIVKHRLRSNEMEAFGGGQASATKVILPIDPNDLRSGAQYFFVGERGYEDLLADVGVGQQEADRRDAALLGLLDGLPSLDPFLMREKMRKEGLAPARCYFDLTQADTSRMFNFARSELAPLVGLTFNDGDTSLNDKTLKLAQKILANAGDAELEPLRESLGMAKAEFEEGVFCWKGFIYYKWTLDDLLPRVWPVAAEILRIRPTDDTSGEERLYIDAARERLNRAINLACETVRVTLKVYDDAYNDLTRNGQPKAFREFLLKAPTLFYELGERLGSVHHIVSFWGYRFPTGRRPKINFEELEDLFADFEASLNFESVGRLAA